MTSPTLFTSPNCHVMTDVTFDNWKTTYSVPDELAHDIQLLTDDMQRLIGKVWELRDKEQYAKEHPTKDNRMEVWEAKQELYKLLPVTKILQGGLFK